MNQAEGVVDDKDSVAEDIGSCSCSGVLNFIFR